MKYLDPKFWCGNCLMMYLDFSFKSYSKTF